MYAWIFAHLPGPLWLRIIIAVLLFLGICAALITFVFPWVSEQLSAFNPTL